MEFLMQYPLLGLVIGIATFLIIGLFHPVVVKAEYYWGTGCWWIFLLLGIGGIVWSLCTDNVLVAALAGVFETVRPESHETRLSFEPAVSECSAVHRAYRKERHSSCSVFLE